MATLFGQLHAHTKGLDLAQIVEKLGGKVHKGHDRCWKIPEGVAMEVIDGKPFISQDIGTGPRRNQFDIAHNIGHFVLHYNYRRMILGEHSLRVSAPRYGTDQSDREANYFARVLIMPDTSYTEMYARFSGDHGRLSLHFNTLHSQSIVRARELRLGSTSPERS